MRLLLILCLAIGTLPLTAQHEATLQKGLGQLESGYYTSAAKTFKEARKEHRKDGAAKALFKGLEAKAEAHKRCAAAMKSARKQLERDNFGSATRLAGNAKAAANGFAAYEHKLFAKIDAQQQAAAEALFAECDEQRRALLDELLASARSSMDGNDFLAAKSGFQAAREQMLGDAEYASFRIDDRINEAHALQLEAIADGLVATGDTTLALHRYNDARGMYAISGIQAKVEGLVSTLCDEIPTDKLATSSLSTSETAKLLKVVGSQACNTFLAGLTDDALDLVEDLVGTLEIKLSDDPARNEIYATAATELVRSLLEKVKVD